MHGVMTPSDVPRTQTSATPALLLQSVRVPFGDNGGGLHNITLSVAPGERVAILGPSGVGKTTLLRAVAGLAPIDGGEIEVGGQRVTTRPPERRDTVYLHQVPALFAHLSVLDNVAFPLRVRGVGREERYAAAQAALERLHLGPYSTRAVSALSGGQRHRVALARALVARPRVLLLDEPLAALDPALRRDVRDAIFDVTAGTDAALLLVTHDLDDAALLGDRVGVLLDAAIAQIAPPAELFAKPATVGVMRLLGVHQEFGGHIDEHGNVHTPFGVLRGADVSGSTPSDAPSDALSGAPSRAARLRGDCIVGIRADALVVVAAQRGAVSVGVVERIVQRPSGATARIRFAGAGAHANALNDASSHVTIDAAIDPYVPPVVGAAVSVTIDSRGVLVFSR